VLKFNDEAPQVTVSEGLTQGPYVAAKAGLEPTTLWMKGEESTNAPSTVSLSTKSYIVYKNKKKTNALRQPWI